MTHTQRLIKTILAKKGYSAYHLSIEAGIDPSQVSRWQRNQDMGYGTAHDLCSSIGLSLPELIFEMASCKACQRLTDQAMDNSSKV